MEQALKDNEVASRRGYDHNFCLKGGREFKDAAAVVSQTTGIKLICSTDQPGLQLYTGNFIAESTPGKGGVYGPRSGFLPGNPKLSRCCKQPKLPLTCGAKG